MNLPSVEIISILHAEKKSQNDQKCHPMFSVWKWNHVPDFHSTEYFIAHYLVPSPTEFLNCYACHVWYPLKMKSGTCDLPDTPQERWE